MLLGRVQTRVNLRKRGVLMDNDVWEKRRNTFLGIVSWQGGFGMQFLDGLMFLWLSPKMCSPF